MKTKKPQPQLQRIRADNKGWTIVLVGIPSGDYIFPAHLISRAGEVMVAHKAGFRHTFYKTRKEAKKDAERLTFAGDHWPAKFVVSRAIYELVATLKL